MNNLKKLRNNLNKTQAEVAKFLNVSKYTYMYYESERIQLNAQTLIKLAEYFNTTTDNVLGYKAHHMIDTSTLTDLQKDVINKIINSNENVCLQINSYIDGLKTKNK